MNKITVYTDGAYSSTRNQGGHAFVIVQNDKQIHYECGGVKETTNNRMELLAIMEAVEWLKWQEIPDHQATIISDSMYCIGCISKGWQRKKNIDMWEEFDKLEFNYNIKHVKGHSGDKWNDICDIWACHGRDLIL